MLDRIKSLFSGKQAVTGPAPAGKGGPNPALGRYAWAPVESGGPGPDGETDFRLQDGLERALAVCEPGPGVRADEVGVILSCYETPAYFLAAMFVRGELALKKHVHFELVRRGEKECRDIFACWPPAIAPCGFDFGQLGERELFLFSALASLPSDRAVSPATMPKSVAKYLRGAAFSQAVSKLNALGLVVAKEGALSFPPVGPPVEARALLAEAVGVARFAAEAEGYTIALKQWMDEAQKKRRKLTRELLYPDHRQVCPACTTVLKGKTHVPADAGSLLPFHYLCMTKWDLDMTPSGVIHPQSPAGSGSTKARGGAQDKDPIPPGSAPLRPKGKLPFLRRKLH